MTEVKDSEKTRAEPLELVLARYSADVENGLSDETAARRLIQFGANQMTARQSQSSLTIFIRQFQGTVVVLLLVAAVISVLMHEMIQAAGIMAAVIVNAVVGFLTEMKAKISLESLARLSGPTARTLRSGHEVDLPAKELVPGDLIVLEAGSRVPADLRLIVASALSIDESSMTGESVPVMKSVSDEDDLLCSAYQGTVVLSGQGRGIVTATGDRTRLGNLGRLLAATSFSRTPLEESLEDLGKQLTWLTVITCIVLACVGIWQSEDIWLMVQTSIALAVAAIPEGMPVVATLALAVGTRRMVKSKALIRQLSAVETLGCTTVICTDKTGTLTENEMTVTRIVAFQREYKVEGSGYQPEGKILQQAEGGNGGGNGSGNGGSDAAKNNLSELLSVATLCNDATLECHDGEEGWHVHGDPTEGALIVAAGKIGLKQAELQSKFPRLNDIPFDLRKRMSTIHEVDGSLRVCTKGAPESIFKRSVSYMGEDGPKPLGESELAWFKQQNDDMAKHGLRVLAIASRHLDSIASELVVDEVENELTLLGLVGMSDRPRAGVKEALAICQKAGIRVIMVTGDQASTARTIARELGFTPSNDPRAVVTGSELNSANESERRLILQSAEVLARVTPEMKLSVVKALQENGEIVAMTGDGINDAAALRQANIGVAVGSKATDLAREASSMVLTDDNFATIVKAIREGRIIYANIRKSIAYLLTAGLSSVVCVASGVFFATGLPLTPLQLLWLNLIMHVFPGLGIVLERNDCDVMSLNPRKREEKLISRGILTEIIIRSFVVGAAVMVSLQIGRQLHVPADSLSTVGFGTISLALLLQAVSWSRFDNPQSKLRAGRALVGNIGISLLLLIAAIYLPFLQIILTTKALDPTEIMVVVAVSIVSILISDLIRKLRSPASLVKA